MVALIVQERHTTAAAWTLDNDVLAAGVQGVETDTGKVKLGDGVSAWNVLAYERAPFAHAASHLPGQADSLLDFQLALQRLRQAMAVATTPTGGLVKLLFVGDSIVGGKHVASVVDKWINLVKDYIANCIGLLSPAIGYVSFDPTGAGSVAGFWSGDAGTHGTDGLGLRSWLSASGSANVREATFFCDRFTIDYSKGSGYGGFTVSVDGSVVATIDCHQSAAGSTMTRYDSGALTLAAHDIKITTVNTQTVATYSTNLAGLMPYVGNFSSGVQLWQAAKAGAPSWPIGPTFFVSSAELDQISLIQPDAVFLCYGTNDETFNAGSPGSYTATGYTKVNFETSRTNIAAALGYTPSYINVITWPKLGDEAAFIPYHDAIQASALATKSALVDIYYTLGYQGANTGLWDEVGHPNVQGSIAYAQTVARALGVETAKPGLAGGWTSLQAHRLGYIDVFVEQHLMFEGDQRALLQPGTKLRWCDGTTKYGVVGSVALGQGGLTGVTTGTTAGGTLTGGNVFNKTAHGLSTLAAPVQIFGLVNTTGLLNGDIVYIQATTTNTFTLTGTKGGSAITLTGTADTGIVISPVTDVIPITTTDYTVVQSVSPGIVQGLGTIYSLDYSYQEAPQGFPAVFNWTPTLVGWSSNPTSAVYQWHTFGRWITVTIAQNTNGTSSATNHTAGVPVTAATVANGNWKNPCQAVDNGTTQTGILTVPSGSALIGIQGIIATGANTATGNSRIISGSLSYPF